METPTAVIVSAARTPIGKMGSALADQSALDLGVIVADEALRRAGLSASDVDEVVFGNCGGNPPNVARAVALKLQGGGSDRHTLPGITLQRNCGSGHEAVMYAARAIAAGERDVMVAGGTESMSGYPVSVESSNKLRERLKSRGKEVLAYKRKFRLGDLKDIGDDVGFVNTLWAGLSDPITEVTMPATAEKLARKYELTREELDEFAMLSHRRAERSTKDGLFCREIVPVKGLAYDECIRSPDPKAYREAKRIPGAAGTGLETDLITPLNACPINDGAGAVLVMSERTARERGLPIMGYVTAYASEACDPAIMGIGPAYAIRTLLQRHEVRTGRKLTLDDIAQVEINEAFAAVALANAKELGLPIEKVNPRGGAIALGHPVGATGARNAATALYSMMANGYERAIVSACVGGGQGVAYLLERPDNAKTLGR